MKKYLTGGDDDNTIAKQASKRIPQLEGLRFIMCCIIILSHLEFLGESVCMKCQVPETANKENYPQINCMKIT